MLPRGLWEKVPHLPLCRVHMGLLSEAEGWKARHTTRLESPRGSSPPVAGPQCPGLKFRYYLSIDIRSAPWNRFLINKLFHGQSSTTISSETEYHAVHRLFSAVSLNLLTTTKNEATAWLGSDTFWWRGFYVMAFTSERLRMSWLIQ